MTSPQETLRLIEKLEALGFTDSAFALLHHSRVRGWHGTIAGHRQYCAKTGEFQADRENERVQRRLALVLAAYAGGPFQSGSSAVFSALAEAAFAEVPPLKGSGE